MTDPDEFTHALGAARDLTGHPGHDKLRAYWEVPPGGWNPQRPTATPKGGDITGNLIKAYQKKNDAITAANRPKAIAAHTDYVAGMSMDAIRQKHGLSRTSLYSHWQALGLPYARLGEKRPAQEPPPPIPKPRRRRASTKTGRGNSTKPKGNLPKLDKAQVMSLYRRHEAGETLTALASTVGIDRKTIRRRFRAYGLPIIHHDVSRPSTYPPRTTRNYVLTTEQVAAAKDAHSRGATWKDIAAEMGVSTQCLVRARKRVGHTFYDGHNNAKKMNPEQVIEAMAAHEQGELLKDIAARFGVNRSTLRAHIQKAKREATP